MTEAWRRVVLVVDDDPWTREAIGEVVEDAGYAVVFAANGNEAVDLLRAAPGRYALVLLDMMMPEARGDAVVDAMRADGIAVPVVVLSASEHPSVAAPVVAFRRKPCTLRELLELLHKHALGAPPGDERTALRAQEPA